MSENRMLETLALAFATGAHGAINQRRKYDDLPYIVHPIAVAKIVQSVTDDSAMIAAAYLHDVVEDTKITLAVIQELFGTDVALLVEELTDVSKLTDGNRETRKTLDREHSAKASARGQTIKVADLIDNARSIVAHDEAFTVTYMREKRLLLPLLTKANATLLGMAWDSVKQYEQSKIDNWFEKHPNTH